MNTIHNYNEEITKYPESEGQLKNMNNIQNNMLEGVDLENMNLADYQKIAVNTAIYGKGHAITYPALGLGNEAGEVLGKIKKVLRDNDGIFDSNSVMNIKSEIGDVLWYMAALCRDLGINLQDVAIGNIRKLIDRKERGTIQGNGDDR